jgi:hypothetical protein
MIDCDPADQPSLRRRACVLPLSCLTTTKTFCLLRCDAHGEGADACVVDEPSLAPGCTRCDNVVRQLLAAMSVLFDNRFDKAWPRIQALRAIAARLTLMEK